MSKSIRSIVVATCVAALVAACSGEPATADDVEEDLREDYAGQGGIIWIAVEDRGEGEFHATFDVGESEENERGSTYYCTINADSNSWSRNCDSVEPSVPIAIQDFLTGRFGDAGLAPTGFDMRRTDDGDYAGEVSLRHVASGETGSTYVTCDVEVTDGRTEWDCDQNQQGG